MLGTCTTTFQNLSSLLNILGGFTALPAGLAPVLPGATPGQLPVWNGNAYAPLLLGGDVLGPPDSVDVIALRNRPLANDVPADGEVLTWDQANSQIVWAPGASTLAGDVTGPSGANTVVRIQNVPILAPATDRTVARYNQTAGQIEWASTDQTVFISALAGIGPITSANWTTNEYIGRVSADSSIADPEQCVPFKQRLVNVNLRKFRLEIGNAAPGPSGLTFELFVGNTNNAGYATTGITINIPAGQKANTNGTTLLLPADNGLVLRLNTVTPGGYVIGWAQLTAILEAP